MAHLTEQLRHRLLARALPSAEILAAIEHVRTCTSCREELIALRSNHSNSLANQILPTESDEHPPNDLLAAYADNDLEAAERASIMDHLKSCHLCREITADLGHFKNELQQLPPKNYQPSPTAGREGVQPRRSTLPRVWVGIAEWFTQPVIWGTTVAVAMIIVVGLVATRGFYWPPAQSQLSVDTIQDSSLTFRVAANGQLLPPSTSLPKDAVAVLAGSILDLARAQLPSMHLLRGASETPGATVSDFTDETKLPSGEYFFSRRIFGTIVGLPRATPDPDAQPNGVVIRDTNPVLSWSAVSQEALNQTLTVTDCATDQVIVKTDLSGDVHNFTMPVSLQRGGFYLWQITVHSAPEKTASGRFKVASENDVLSLASPEALSSGLLKAFLLARTGLFAEAETELTKLETANPKSPTITTALEYVRRLEGN